MPGRHRSMPIVAVRRSWSCLAFSRQWVRYAHELMSLDDVLTRVALGHRAAHVKGTEFCGGHRGRPGMGSPGINHCSIRVEPAGQRGRAPRAVVRRNHSVSSEKLRARIVVAGSETIGFDLNPSRLLNSRAQRAKCRGLMASEPHPMYGPSKTRFKPRRFPQQKLGDAYA